MLAENRFSVPRALISAGRIKAPERLCTLGLPRNMPTDCAPCSQRIDPRRFRITLNAFSHVVGSSAPSELRTKGDRKRVGSECSSPSATPLGQINPWLNTSSLSPRTDSMEPAPSKDAIVKVRPQLASHRGQIRNADSDMRPACHERQELSSDCRTQCPACSTAIVLALTITLRERGE